MSSKSSAKLIIPEIPRPPASIVDTFKDVYAPAHELDVWVRNTFLNEESPLFNIDHIHLLTARIGYVWTNVHCAKNMRAVAGQAEVPLPQGGKWQKGRALFLLESWFGHIPDFVITIYARVYERYRTIELCALVEHELYHCAQKTDDYGVPQFTKQGKPKYGIKAHDVEEHTGIIRRYGVEAASINVKEFVETAREKPELSHLFDKEGDFNFKQVCGTCK